MEIFEAIETRHSVRKFKADIPPIEDVKKIINAARLAPSSTNDQMWHFIVIYNTKVKNKMKQAIIETYDEILTWKEAEGKESKINFYKQFSAFFTDAPVNIAVLMEPKESLMADIMREKGVNEKKISKMRPDSGLLSIGAAIENLSLAAHALGYGSCWLTAPLYACKKLEEILEVKSPYQLVSLLCLGKPESPAILGTQKKALSEIITVIE
ncbi:MAG: nitroreductase family protein [Candidatus Gastranaerophilales bacterium]|nr:nitroreductase family protein [Candidatus Gastranaerophilales bacterium]